MNFFERHSNLPNTVANMLRTERGISLTVEMLEAELKEIEALIPKNSIQEKSKNDHIKVLKLTISRKKQNQNL